MAIFVVVVGENFFWLSKTIPSTMAVILRVEWFLKRHKRSFGRERGAKTLTLERQENFGNDEKRSKENSRVSAQLVLPQWVSAA